MSPKGRESLLVQRAVGGDAVALTALLTDVRPRVFTHIANRIPSELRRSIDADDIVQSALVNVYRGVGDFEDRGAGSFYRWVATIAARQLRDARRQHRAARRGGGRPIADGNRGIEDSMVALIDLVVGSGHTPSRSVARHEAIAAVQTALDALPEDHRRAIWLVNIEGRSVAAAAAEMGRSERAIHNLCYKGRQRLRELLGSGSRFLSG